ncbi:MAG: NUDIX domain-containing protein [Candidatus Aminicenantales bacterium]
MTLSAGIIVVRKEEGRWKYLFLRAYRNWDFPKGEVEEGEDPFETALRETEEETGISNLKFAWGRVFKETEPYRRGQKIARYYIASTTQENITFAINPELGAPEHHEYRWLTYEELKALAPPRLLPVIEWARNLLGMA